MLTVVVVLWIVSACLTCKVNAILSNQETWGSSIFIGLIVWPLVFVSVMFTRHYTGVEDAAGRRVEGKYPDAWEY